MKYAVKYLRISLDEEVDVIIPIDLINGVVHNGLYFEEYGENGRTMYSYLANPVLEGKYVVGEALSFGEIKRLYDRKNAGYSEKEILNLYFMDVSDKVGYIKNGKRVNVSTFDLFDDQSERTKYDLVDGEACCLLNKKVVDILCGVDDISALKDMLYEYVDRIADFNEKRLSQGIQTIYVKDGQVSLHVQNSSMLANAPVALKSGAKVNINTGGVVSKSVDPSSVSVRGLYTYLRERVFGHDEELKNISTILLMNYLANDKSDIESICIPGPTGSGKTVTFDCAADYFAVPFKRINTVNLVPEGIEGTSLEKHFASLISACNGDIELAQKAMLVFDEFDKLNRAKSDYKEVLKDIFLKVIEGSEFPINAVGAVEKIYNTSFASQIFLGTFEEAFDSKKRPIGFDSRDDTDEIDVMRKIIDSGYYSEELLTRITHFIPYSALDDETKLRIITDSKLSTFLRKKERLKEQFGVEICGDRDFAEGLISSLDVEDKSMRVVNNIIARSVLDAQFEILDNPHKYKKLVLSRDTVSKGTFDLI